jgi:hypothetical protein
MYAGNVVVTDCGAIVPGHDQERMGGTENIQRYDNPYFWPENLMNNVYRRSAGYVIIT